MTRHHHEHSMKPVSNGMDIPATVSTMAAVLFLAIPAESTQAANVLNSVAWTGQAPVPTSQLGGSWIYGSVTGTTGLTPGDNSGVVFSQDWGQFPFSAGYSTSSNSATAIGGPGNTTSTETISLSGVVPSLFLFFNFVDYGTSFDFGTYDWYLVAANNAHRSGSKVIVDSGATTNGNLNQGFLVRIDQGFGPGTDLSFNFVNTNSNDKTVGFTIAAIPEPGSVVLILLSSGMFLARRKR